MNILYLSLKVFITAILVVSISEISKRSSALAAFLASLPLTSLLAFLWMFVEKQETEKFISLSYDIFWLVIPSLALFLFFPFFLKRGWSVPLSLAVSSVMTSAVYYFFHLLLELFRKKF